MLKNWARLRLLINLGLISRILYHTWTPQNMIMVSIEVKIFNVLLLLFLSALTALFAFLCALTALFMCSYCSFCSFYVLLLLFLLFSRFWKLKFFSPIMTTKSRKSKKSRPRWRIGRVWVCYMSLVRYKKCTIQMYYNLSVLSLKCTIIKYSTTLSKSTINCGINNVRYSSIKINQIALWLMGYKNAT